MWTNLENSKLSKLMESVKKLEEAVYKYNAAQLKALAERQHLLGTYTPTSTISPDTSARDSEEILAEADALARKIKDSI